MVAGIAELGGHDLLQRARIDGLREARILGLGQAAGIDGEEEIGRAVLALGRQPLVEARGGVDHVGLDARLVGEGLEQRVDQLRLAIGVDVDLALRLRRRREAGQRRDEDSELRKAARGMRDDHRDLQSSGFKAPASDCGQQFGPPRPALVVILIAVVKIISAERAVRSQLRIILIRACSLQSE